MIGEVFKAFGRGEHKSGRDPLLGRIGSAGSGSGPSSNSGGATLGSASPFNIASMSLKLANFTEDEVGALYAQHTADTGQVFPSEAVSRAFHWSQGQPWLVNALAREVVDKILGMDYVKVNARSL